MTWIISTPCEPTMYWHKGATPTAAGVAWLEEFFPQHLSKAALVKSKGDVADFAVEDIRFRVSPMQQKAKVAA